MRYKREFVKKVEGEYAWVSYIKKRIRRNQDFIAVFHGGAGGRGTGKTWTATSVACEIDPEFDETRVVSSAREMMALVNSNKLKKGSVIVWDEAQIDLSSRNWQHKTNKLMNFLISTFRHKNWILFFTTPYSDFVDVSIRKMFHAQFECVSINYKEGLVKMKPQLLEYNPRLRKFYTPRLIVLDNGKFKPIDTWEMTKPPIHLIDAVERRKEAYTAKLNKEIESAILKEGMEGENTILSSKGKKSPTEFQEKMIELDKKNITSTGEMAEILGVPMVKISVNKKFLRNKGIYLGKVGFDTN